MISCSVRGIVCSARAATAKYISSSVSDMSSDVLPDVVSLAHSLPQMLNDSTSGFCNDGIVLFCFIRRFSARARLASLNLSAFGWGEGGGGGCTMCDEAFGDVSCAACAVEAVEELL